jgi:hypothetical protein
VEKKTTTITGLRNLTSHGRLELEGTGQEMESSNFSLLKILGKLGLWLKW